jgi:hypothetical protein
MQLVAQPALGADAEAVANDQHADHQLGIDGGPANVAVVGPEVLAYPGQIDKAVNRPEQVIHWHVPIEIEAVEERCLQHRPLAHHRPILR